MSSPVSLPESPGTTLSVGDPARARRTANGPHLRRHVAGAWRAASWIGLLSLGLVAGCVSYGPGSLQPGEPAQDAIESMGQPTATLPRPEGGKRLEFARGPMGQHTYMIDVDPSGRIDSIRQVLDEKTFATLKPGMTRDEVLYRIGTPSDRMRIARQNLDIWSYRYFVNFCQWFQVSIDITSGQVRETGYGPDPMCEAGGDEVQVMLGGRAR